MATGTSLKFNASHQAVVVLLGLEAILVWPLARTRLLKLYWQLPSQVVLVIRPVWAQISTANAVVQE